MLCAKLVLKEGKADIDIIRCSGIDVEQLTMDHRQISPSHGMDLATAVQTVLVPHRERQGIRVA